MMITIDTRMIDAIADISIALKIPASDYNQIDKQFIWIMDLQEIHLDIKNKTVFLADCKGVTGSKNISHKQYLLLEGIAAFYGLTLEHGYIDYSKD